MADLTTSMDDGVRDNGVSAQNGAEAGAGFGDAVLGLDRQIALLKDAAARLKLPETKEEREERERKERSKRVMAAVGDGLSALGNLFFASRGAPNMYDYRSMGQQRMLDDRLERLRRDREENDERYYQYQMRAAALEHERAKTLRELEAQQQAMEMAREKALREAEKHSWEAALQPDRLREQKGRADKAGSDAETAAWEARFAPQMQQEKLNTERARGAAANASAAASHASAANSYASAAEHRKNAGEQQEVTETTTVEHDPLTKTDKTRTTRTTRTKGLAPKAAPAQDAQTGQRGFMDVAKDVLDGWFHGSDKPAKNGGTSATKPANNGGGGSGGFAAGLKF